MIFAAALTFDPLMVTVVIVVAILLIALAVLASAAGAGFGHFLANKKAESIRESEADYEIAKMAHSADAPHFEKLFKALATGSLFGKRAAKKELYDLAKNPEALRKAMTKSAEHWLASEGTTLEGRKEIEANLRAIAKEHHGDALGTFASQVLKMLEGVKDQTVVPTADGGTVTVPTTVIHNHTHYHGEDAAKAEQAVTASAGDSAAGT